MSKSRNYCFTINNYTDQDEEALADLDCKYVCYGKEVGESLTPHLQGFVQFHSQRSLKALSKLIPRAHLEAAKGTPVQAITYCEKGGLFKERGLRPLTHSENGAKGGAAEKARWNKEIKLVAEKKYSECDPKLLVSHFSGLHKAAAVMYPNQQMPDTESKMYWYYGPSGSGKSRRAIEENPGHYKKMCNKWWDGYIDQKVVLIEDFDNRHEKLVHHLKIWADRYAFGAEVKGGKIDIRPETIIVTSNYHPREIWSDPRDLDPVLRRFSIVKFGNDYVYTPMADTFRPLINDH